MKAKRIVVSLLTVVSLLVLAAGCSHGRFHRGDCSEYVLEHIDDHVEDFELNEEQNEKYQALRTRLAADLSKHSSKRKEFKQSLYEKINQDNPDIGVVKNMLKGKLNEMPGAISVYLDYFEEFYNILNAEQQKELLDEVRKKMKRHMKR